MSDEEASLTVHVLFSLLPAELFIHLDGSAEMNVWSQPLAVAP